MIILNWAWLVVWIMSAAPPQEDKEIIELLDGAPTDITGLEGAEQDFWLARVERARRLQHWGEVPRCRLGEVLANWYSQLCRPQEAHRIWESELTHCKDDELRRYQAICGQISTLQQSHASPERIGPAIAEQRAFIAKALSNAFAGESPSSGSKRLELMRRATAEESSGNTKEAAYYSLLATETEAEALSPIVLGEVARRMRRIQLDYLASAYYLKAVSAAETLNTSRLKFAIGALLARFGIPESAPDQKQQSPVTAFAWEPRACSRFFGEAEGALKGCVDDPDTAIYEGFLAALYMDTGQLSEAALHSGNSVRRNSQNNLGWYVLCVTQGHKDGAKSEYEILKDAVRADNAIRYSHPEMIQEIRRVERELGVSLRTSLLESRDPIDADNGQDSRNRPVPKPSWLNWMLLIGASPALLIFSTVYYWRRRREKSA